MIPTQVPAPNADPPRPVAGDTTTLYTLEQASSYVKLHPSTIRRLVRVGDIPPGYLTRVGAVGRGGKVFMSADQIVRLIEYFATRTNGADPDAHGVREDPVRRRRRVGP